MPSSYLFQSTRLGFRQWQADDLDAMAWINADAETMAFFPATSSRQQTADFISRMNQQFDHSGFCYFAVETLHDQQFIGFIGLCQQHYVAPFTPCVDIGWRLNRRVWRQGLATEGATRCLNWAFTNLAIPRVLAVAPVVNRPSIRVMQKIGMHYRMNFDHPALSSTPHLQDCVVYQIDQTERA